MKHFRTPAGLRPGRRIALGAAVGGVVAALGLGGLGVAAAGATPKPGPAAATAVEKPGLPPVGDGDGGKPPVVVPPGGPEIPVPLPDTEKPPQPAAPEPGPRPKPLPGVQVPDSAAVVAAVTGAAPELRPEKATGDGPGKFFFRAADASVQVDVRAGGSPDDEVDWAVAEAAHSGVAGTTTTRTLGAGGRAVVTSLPHGAQVGVFTAEGLRVTAAVYADGKVQPTDEQVLALARAIAELG